MKERYVEKYKDAYELPVPDHVRLLKLVRTECEKSGIEWRKVRKWK